MDHHCYCLKTAILTALSIPSQSHLLELTQLQVILGKVRKFPATLDEDLRKKLIDCSKNLDIPIAEGHTMCTNDFYEGTDNAHMYYSK